MHTSGESAGTIAALVLCTVNDPEYALREFACVLRSRGRRVARHAADRPSARGGTGDSVIWTVVDFAGAVTAYG